MPRKRIKTAHQTGKENAGVQNFTEKDIEKMKLPERDESLGALLPVFKKGIERTFRKPNWTADDLAEELGNYFQYCYMTNLKPCKAGIRMWLGCSSSQYYDWQVDKNGRYGDISEIICKANDYIENSYIGRSEKYPTANIFLLKSSHGHIESSKLDITTDGKAITDPNEVDEMVKKLGLDKK